MDLFIYLVSKCENFVVVTSYRLFCIRRSTSSTILISSFYFQQCDSIGTFFSSFVEFMMVDHTKESHVLQYISHLVNQLARHQFLKIACQLERKTILGAYSLLKVIESELEGYLSAGNGRVVCKQLFIISASYVGGLVQVPN